MPEFCTVHTLLGKAQTPLAIRCLSSLQRCSAELVRLMLHDDGSLDDEASAQLREALGPDVNIIKRAEADQRMNDALSKYPNLAEYRREHHFGLKLLDPMLLDDGEQMNFCDTDVLFFRPMTGLYELPDGVSAIFMRDFQQAYSVRRPRNLFTVPGLRLPDKGNTGIIAMKRSAFDLDWLERVIPNRGIRRPIHFTEQTLYAALGARSSCCMVDPNQIPVVAPETDPNEPWVGAHFVGPVRDRIDAFEAAQPDPAQQQPVKIQFEPGGKCGYRDLRRQMR